MTATARQREADRAGEAFQLVLTSIGVETITDALVLWEEVPDRDKTEKVAGWIDQMVELVMSRRTLAVQVALAYYRLIRALRTGSTIADPATPEPKYVTLDKLRHEFNALAEPRLAQRYKQRLLAADAQNEARKAAQRQREGALDEDRILVEEIESLKAKEEADAQAADEELRREIEALGLDYKQRMLDRIDTRKAADEVDRLRNEAHDRAGVRQAAAGERVAMNGGRSTLWNAAAADARAIGWIRVSRTGTPCYFCAMLISRGAVYKSEASATYADGDKYHDNCHCYAVPVFSRDEYESGDQYQLNREYQDLWPRVTRGLSGKAAMLAWRRYFRAHPPKASAQAAPGRTTTAQEA